MKKWIIFSENWFWRQHSVVPKKKIKSKKNMKKQFTYFGLFRVRFVSHIYHLNRCFRNRCSNHLFCYGYRVLVKTNFVSLVKLCYTTIIFTLFSNLLSVWLFYRQVAHLPRAITFLTYTVFLLTHNYFMAHWKKCESFVVYLHILRFDGSSTFFFPLEMNPLKNIAAHKAFLCFYSVDLLIFKHDETKKYSWLHWRWRHCLETM